MHIGSDGLPHAGLAWLVQARDTQASATLVPGAGDLLQQVKVKQGIFPTAQNKQRNLQI